MWFFFILKNNGINYFRQMIEISSIALLSIEGKKTNIYFFFFTTKKTNKRIYQNQGDAFSIVMDVASKRK